MQFIDLKKQYLRIETEVQNAIQKVLNHGQYIMGPEIFELEKQLAEFVGARHAVVNSSGTDALLMALMALDVKAGDEVITTPFSFFATAEVILMLGATPIFVDIEPHTYNIDSKKIEAAITAKTKAIMPVSLYGQCADISEINRIANKHSIAVIEDGAQSFGATHHGNHSCGLSTIGCTSFFPSKPLGGYGDSGACFTDDDTLAQRLKEIRIHGQNARYSHNRIGINGRMDTIQAAVLLEKLKLFPEEIKLRQQVASRYNNLLADCLDIHAILPENNSVYAQFTIEVEDRESFQQALQAKGIPTAVHYPIAMHQQEALAHLGYKTGDFPRAEYASKRVVSLPMHPYLTEQELQQICEAVKTALLVETA